MSDPYWNEDLDKAIGILRDYRVKELFLKQYQKALDVIGMAYLFDSYREYEPSVKDYVELSINDILEKVWQNCNSIYKTQTTGLYPTRDRVLYWYAQNCRRYIFSSLNYSVMRRRSDFYEDTEYITRAECSFLKLSDEYVFFLASLFEREGCVETKETVRKLFELLEKYQDGKILKGKRIVFD